MMQSRSETRTGIHKLGSHKMIIVSDFLSLFICILCSSLLTPLWFCLRFCPNDKTKTAETKISKLGTEIVHEDTSPTNEYYVNDQKSKVKVRVIGLVDWVAGMSYAPPSSVPLVKHSFLKVFHVKSAQNHDSDDITYRIGLSSAVLSNVLPVESTRLLLSCILSLLETFVATHSNTIFSSLSHWLIAPAIYYCKGGRQLLSVSLLDAN